jgi:hypothetical protein
VTVPDRDTMLASLKTWISHDTTRRRAALASMATRLGLPAGRAWDAIPDADLVALRRAIRATDDVRLEEFDSFIPF